MVHLLKVAIKGDEVRMIPINLPIPTAFFFGFLLAIVVIADKLK